MGIFKKTINSFFHTFFEILSDIITSEMQSRSISRDDLV